MSVPTIIKNDKKTIRAWALFDWANSSYALVISTAVFPIYYTAVTEDTVRFFNLDVNTNTIYSFAITLSYIVIAMLSPLLSGIADFSGRRLFFLKMFTLIGSLACMGMFFFKSSTDVWVGTTAFIVATIGFAGSLVFYDSFLPIIATEDQFDKVSAKGFSYGYVGSVILLVFILMMIQKPEWFGMEGTGLPTRIGFVLVGIWWLIFSQITFRNMPKDQKSKFSKGVFAHGYSEIKQVFAEAKQMASLKAFLISFFLYSAGVQTVIYVATLFSEQELGMESGELIMTVLIIQLVGILGAWFFARLSGKIGNKYALLIQIAIWMLVCIGAFFCYSKMFFFGLAASVGMVMGGIQALSRASYSKLLPENEDDVTSYFSLYDVVYKSAIVAGTFLFGLVNLLTGNMRYSVLVLVVLFILGGLAMLRVNFTEKIYVHTPNPSEN